MAAPAQLLVYERSSAQMPMRVPARSPHPRTDSERPTPRCAQPLPEPHRDPALIRTGSERGVKNLFAANGAKPLNWRRFLISDRGRGAAAAGRAGASAPWSGSHRSQKCDPSPQECRKGAPSPGRTAERATEKALAGRLDRPRRRPLGKTDGTMQGRCRNGRYGYAPGEEPTVCSAFYARLTLEPARHHGFGVSRNASIKCVRNTRDRMAGQWGFPSFPEGKPGGGAAPARQGRCAPRLLLGPLLLGPFKGTVWPIRP